MKFDKFRWSCRGIVAKTVHKTAMVCGGLRGVGVQGCLEGVGVQGVWKCSFTALLVDMSGVPFDRPVAKALLLHYILMLM